MSSIGNGIDRTDGPDKVRGIARYTADEALENLAHAVLVTSTIACGRIVAIETDAAERAPGVLLVMTHENAQCLPKGGNAGYGPPAGRMLTVLQDDRVHYNDQPIAVVVADSLEHAAHAARYVTVQYDASEPALDFDQARKDASTPEENADARRGDAERALERASVRLGAIYKTPLEFHNAMEPHATTAVWEGNRLTLYESTQFVYGVRKVAAKTFNIPEDDVRVISRNIGGAFGAKGSVWSHVILAAMAAKTLSRPVRLALERPQLFSVVSGRPRTEQSIELGASESGKLAAIAHDTISHTSQIEEWTEECGSGTRMLYDCPNVRVTHRLVKLNLGTPTFMRAPGHTPGSFALESALDELAYTLAIDPVELRLRNDAEQDPGNGRPWSSKRLRECYARAGERFGWSRRNPELRSMREGETLIGWGMATATYPTHRSRASASVEMLADGTAVVRSATHEIGTGTYTVLAQIAADALGVEPHQVRIEIGDTTLPRAPISAGSMTVASVGPAVAAACRTLREQIERGESPLRASADVKAGDEAKQFSMHAFGAVFVEVRVDPDLGEVRVSRVVGAYDAGRIINEKTARNQVIGGIVMGIGMALTEQGLLDISTGRIANANLADYYVPVNADVGNIDVLFVAEEDPHVNSLGAKGIGEIGITGVAAAIANAVHHATGRRVRELPITLDKLL